MPGDVVLLPTGAAHALASALDAATVPFHHAAAEQALAAGEELHLGTGIGQTRILCASYHQDPAITYRSDAVGAATCDGHRPF
jgi:Cupin